MAKYKCPYCPHFAHTSGSIPNHSEWLMLSAVDWDLISESISSSDLYRKSLKLYKCISCDAIAIFWAGFGEAPTWYAPSQK
jgi:hypothetical protein